MTHFKQNLELREKVFRKMGWEVKYSHTNNEGEKYYRWEKKGKKLNNIVFHLEDAGGEVVLSPIEIDWAITAKYLVAFMSQVSTGFTNDGYFYEILSGEFFWFSDGYIKVSKAEIINDNISEAACKAFMEGK